MQKKDILTNYHIRDLRIWEIFPPKELTFYNITIYHHISRVLKQLLIYYAGQCYQSNFTGPGFFQVTQGCLLPNAYITVSATSLTQCTLWCQLNGQCLAAAFSSVTSACHLYNQIARPLSDNSVFVTLATKRIFPGKDNL